MSRPRTKTNRPKQNGSRSIKIACDRCKWICRASQKSIALGVPACPNRNCDAYGQSMTVGATAYVTRPGASREGALAVGRANGVPADVIDLVNAIHDEGAR